MTDNAINLDAIEARASAATPEPWKSQNVAGGLRLIVAHEYGTVGETVDDMAEENGRFIAHARTDVPALIAEVQRLRLQVQVLEQDVSPWLG